MSVVIAYSTDVLSIILTDKRVSFGKYAEFGYSDDGEKLINLSDMGWAAGAGVSEYLYDLKQNLSSENIKDVKDIINVYQKISNTYFIDPNYSKEDIDMSAVVASWLGFDEKICFFKFNVGILSSQHISENGIKTLSPNQIFTLYPIDYLDNQNKISSLLSKHGCEHQFDGDINKLYEKIFGLFREIAEDSKYVSTTCDIGLHLIQKDGVYKIKLSGEINELMNELKEGRIQERYEVVSAIGKGG